VFNHFVKCLHVSPHVFRVNIAHFRCQIKREHGTARADFGLLFDLGSMAVGELDERMSPA
jgi:hypothetical protein